MFLVVDRLLGWVPSPYLRARLLGLAGATVGRNVRVHAIRLVNLESGFTNLRIDDDAHVGTECLIDLSDAVHIGRGAVLAPRVMVLTHQDAGRHHGSLVAEVIGTRLEPTTIGPGAFVGAGATVLCGVHVGHHAVVGAGAVVIADVPPGRSVVGLPATVQADLRPALRALGAEFDVDADLETGST